MLRGDIRPRSAGGELRPVTAGRGVPPLLDPDGFLYVFGYGSLIWRPGFGHLQAHPALLRGFHRRFCIRSQAYRGTPAVPGLVLGLDRGGSCRGLAYRVAAAEAPAVLDYLRERETPGGETVYRRCSLAVRLLDQERDVRAVAYVANRVDQAYCRPEPVAAAAAIAAGFGRLGPNREYLLNTVAGLRALGVRDAGLERIVALLPPALASATVDPQPAEREKPFGGMV